MRRIAYLALILSCGGDAPSLIDGEYDYELVGATCNSGAPATGRMAIYESATHGLSGEYDVCNASFAAADLGGGIRGLTFDLNLFGGSILVIGGVVLPGGKLDGPASGLGPGVQFKAKNRAVGTGKTLPPPRDELRRAVPLCEVLRCPPVDGDP